MLLFSAQFLHILTIRHRHISVISFRPRFCDPFHHPHCIVFSSGFVNTPPTPPTDAHTQTWVMWDSMVIEGCDKAMKTQTILIRCMFQSWVSLLPIVISYNLVYRQYSFRGYQWWSYLKLFHPLCGVTCFRFGLLYWVDSGTGELFQERLWSVVMFRTRQADSPKY